MFRRKQVKLTGVPAHRLARTSSKKTETTEKATTAPSQQILCRNIHTASFFREFTFCRRRQNKMARLCHHLYMQHPLKARFVQGAAHTPEKRHSCSQTLLIFLLIPQSHNSMCIFEKYFWLRTGTVISTDPVNCQLSQFATTAPALLTT